MSADNSRFHRKLCAAFSQSFSRDSFIHAVNFKYDSSRSHDGLVALKIALTLAHLYFGRFLSIGLVGENTRPHLASLAHGARYGLSGGFNGVGPDSSGRNRFEPE
ncbi:MAG: hypothetical protein UT80_C0020G0002 [Parcubacteria group bacterium GW2011_GWC1_40_13]|nr:MAG: hypothetical protein UT80_C0020G0002 [Parcubacteria group bacterium GW2011_GWC1_40_13]